MKVHKGTVVAWFPPHPKSGNYVFRDRDSMLEVWKSHGGKEDKLPRVNFDIEMVVAVFLNEGTYRREVPYIRGIEREENELVVTIGQKTFPFNVFNPASIFTIARFDLPVRFDDNKLL